MHEILQITNRNKISMENSTVYYFLNLLIPKSYFDKGINDTWSISGSWCFYPSDTMMCWKVMKKKLWYHLHLIDLKNEDHDPGIPHSKIKCPTNNFEKLVTYAGHHILLIYDQTKKVRIRILFSVFSDFYSLHMIWLAEPSWSQMWSCILNSWECW